jgi:hypothetical protein
MARPAANSSQVSGASASAGWQRAVPWPVSAVVPVSSTTRTFVVPASSSKRPDRPLRWRRARAAPAVVPVNYEVVEDAIVFRTAPDSVPAAAVGTEVAFEADHVDEALSQGWSVLAVGPANVVTEPDAVRGLARRAHTGPWAGGAREMWVSIRPTRLTGRRITPADQ